MMEAVARLLESPLPRVRRRGADILGQLDIPERTFPEEVRGAALVGLARHKDARALEPLMVALQARNVMVLVVEAAQELKNPRLHPLLLQLRDMEGEADAYFSHVLDEAIRSYESPPPQEG